MTPAQIATFLAATCSAYLGALAVPSGNHTCTGVTKIPVTMLVNVTVPVTFRSYTWCLRVPPRCSKYTVQLRDRIQVHTEMHNKTITVCCRGYVEMEGRCVPACPEGADCPFMRCNRTNHCQCTPGYTGLYCNDPCPRGLWGKDCKRPCDCPTGYTCHHLTGDCMVDDRPARKTTTVATTTTTRPPTTTPLPTEATTMETVKTPQFRFPPPPWVEAAGATTPKRITTRIIQDDLSPTPRKIEVTSPISAVTENIKPPLTPPRGFPITFQTPISTTMYITTEKKEYLPTVTQSIPTVRTNPTTLPTPGFTTSRKLNLKEILEQYFTKSSTTTFSPPIVPEIQKISTTGTSPIFASATKTTSSPTVPTLPLTTPAATVHTPTTEETTTRSTLLTTQSTPAITITTEKTTLVALTTTPAPVSTTTPAPVSTTTPAPVSTATPAPVSTTTPAPVSTTTPAPVSTTTPAPVSTTTPAPTTTLTPTTTMNTPTTVTTTTTTPTAISTPTTTVRATTTTTEGAPAILIETTAHKTQPTMSTTGTTLAAVNTLKVPSTTLFNNVLHELKISSLPTPPKIAQYDEIMEKLSTISPEFKVIKVIKTNHSQPAIQKFPTTRDQTFTDSENIHYNNQSLLNIPITIKPIDSNIHQQKNKVKEDGSPIIYISPRTKESNSDLIDKNEVTQLEVSGTTIHFLSPTKNLTTPNKFDGSRRENEIRFKEFISSRDPIETITTDMNTNIQQSNKSLMHSLFSDSKTSEANNEGQIPSNSDQHPEKNYTSDTDFSSTIGATVKSTSQPKDLNYFEQKKKTKQNTENRDKESDSKIFSIFTLGDTTTTLSPIHLLKQLLNATSKPRTTTPSTTLPPKYFEDDFTKEIINKKLKYDDLIVPYSPSEKNKKKHEKMKGGKQSKEAKDGKEHSSTPFTEPENDPEILVPPPLIATSTASVPEVIQPVTQIFSKSTKNRVEETVEHTPMKTNVDHLTSVQPLPDIQRTSNTIKIKDSIRIEDGNMFTTEMNGHIVTDSNNIVGLNTIDTLHTPFEATAKKGLDQEQEDPNYSIMNNRMKLVKTETLYGAAGRTASVPTKPLNGLLITVGSASIMLISLAGIVWVYLRRRRRNMIPRQPCIMAYELPEPTPIDVQNLEQAFFCPTFTNPYAAKINRELQELSYDHPRSSQPEPLYAEIIH